MRRLEDTAPKRRPRILPGHPQQERSRHQKGQRAHHGSWGAPLLFGLLIAALGACQAQNEAPAHPYVRGGALCDVEGRTLILRGVNLSASHKHAPYLGFHGEAEIRAVRKVWGMNALRFLVSWTALEPKPDVYNEAYVTALRKRLDWAHKAGLWVILDMHQDVYGEGFGGNGAPRWTCDEAEYKAHKPISPWFLNYQSPPVMRCFDHLYTDATLRGRFAKMWQHLAEAFASHPAVIGFDILNEPHWGTHSVYSFERERLAPFYTEVVKAVRKAAPHWIAFLEPANSRNLGIPTSLMPFPFDNVAYAPHSYDAQAEQGLGFDPTHRQAIIDNVAALSSEAKRLGTALWIGEYGGVSEHPGIADYLAAQYDAAGAVGASTMVWEYGKGDGYSLLDQDGKSKPVLLEALALPYPRRVAGDLLRYSYAAKSRRFEMTLNPDPNVSAPTIIEIPDRVYGGHYTIECGGCTIKKHPWGIAISDLPPTKAPLTIALTPNP